MKLNLYSTHKKLQHAIKVQSYGIDVYISTIQGKTCMNCKLYLENYAVHSRHHFCLDQNMKYL